MALFDSIQIRAPRLNKFNLSHERKMSFDMGELVPILCEEVLPGDVWRTNSEVMARLAPMLAPIMHRVNVKTESFYCPNRILWDEWEDFITGGRLGTSAPVAPFANTNVIAPLDLGGWGSLADYLGLPELAFDNVNTKINILPFRAYQLIYDEYYRDQNVSASLDILKTSGEVTNAGGELTKLLTLRKRAWEKDYFTSALPFAQRGAAVGIPFELSGYAPIVGRAADGSIDSWEYDATLQPGSGPITTEIESDPDAPVGVATTFGYAKLSDADAANVTTINDLRRSIRLQEWLELAARAGGRYVEHLRAFWGQRSDDARLQRPEFLSGSSAPFRISEVLSTVQQVDPGTGSPVGTPQGDMAGHGTSVGNQAGFKRRFKEHGWVITILSVIPRTAYQDGLRKQFTRFDKFDYAFPQFANIGEQEVLQKEIFFNGMLGTTPDVLFGYQSRYAEYKYGCSTVHGEFRGSLDFWHMGRKFDLPPALDATFITADPTTRIFAVQDETDKIWCHIYNQCDVLRPLPYYGTPTI